MLDPDELYAGKLANVLASVPHRQYVFTVPKLLRSAFERQCAWLGELLWPPARTCRNLAGLKMRENWISRLKFLQLLCEFILRDKHLA